MPKKFVTGLGRRPPPPPPKLSPPRRLLQAIRLHPAKTGVWGAIGALGVLLGIPASIEGIWGPIWPTSPEIYLVQQDPGLPFSLPFTVSNKSIFFGIKKAEELCWIYSLKTKGSDVSGGVNLTSIGFAMLMEIQDIPKNNMRTFYCAIENKPDAVVSGKIKISIDYYEDIFGYLWHRRTTGDVYEWVETTQGGAWVDKGYFSPDHSFPPNTINNP